MNLHISPLRQLCIIQGHFYGTSSQAFKMKLGSSIALLAFGLFNAVSGDGTFTSLHHSSDTSNISQPSHGSASTRTTP